MTTRVQGRHGAQGCTDTQGRSARDRGRAQSGMSRSVGRLLDTYIAAMGNGFVRRSGGRYWRRSRNWYRRWNCYWRRGCRRRWALHGRLQYRRNCRRWRRDCFRRCTRFRICRGRLHDWREHRGGGKIGHVVRTVLFTHRVGGGTDRRKHDEAIAGSEFDWLADRQRRWGITARVRRKCWLRFRFGQKLLILPRRSGMALAGSGVWATRRSRQVGAGEDAGLLTGLLARSRRGVVGLRGRRGRGRRRGRIGIGSSRRRRRGCLGPSRRRLLGPSGTNLGWSIVFPLARLEDHHRAQDRHREP